MRREGWIIAVAMVAVLAAAPVAHADKRVALVIGNATYNHIAHLPNVSHDAAAMAGLFKSAKFDSVETRHNLGVAELRQALREFASRVADADVAVLFYAGHGIEVGQVNYLVPVDARLATDFDVEDETVSLDRVLHAMEPTRKLRLVILDACRENPFTRSMRRTVAARSVGRGLGRVEPSTTNTLIAYATKPNAIAEDGNGPNSPFTVALVKHLMTPGLDLRIALGHVRDEVLASTGSKQEPYITGSLGGGTISIVGDGTPKSSAVPVPMPLTAADRTWAAVKDTDSISALEAFRRQHGAENPIYDRLAEARIEGLRRQHMALANANPVQSRVDDLLVQAKHRINSGDIVGARKILQAPETATSGPLTFMLAETYDPSMLAIWQVKPDGITANPERARALYAKARELGDARAQQRFEWLAAARPTLPPVPVAPLTGPIIKETVPLVKVVPYRPTEPPVSQPAVNLPEILGDARQRSAAVRHPRSSDGVPEAAQPRSRPAIQWYCYAVQALRRATRHPLGLRLLPDGRGDRRAQLLARQLAGRCEAGAEQLRRPWRHRRRARRELQRHRDGCARPHRTRVALCRPPGG